LKKKKKNKKKMLTCSIFFVVFCCVPAVFGAPPASQFVALARVLTSAGCTSRNPSCPSAIQTQIGNETRASEFAGVNSTICAALNIQPFFGCDLNETTIDYLSLRQLNLSGALNGSELAKLSGLTFLRVEKNELLGGSLPAAIGNLTRLTALYLQENNFSGLLPPQLSRLTRLADFRVQGNEFQGSVPPLPASLPATQGCFLQVYTTSPAELGNCFNLTSVMIIVFFWMSYTG
jgi:hypothetical protein